MDNNNNEEQQQRGREIEEKRRARAQKKAEKERAASLQDESAGTTATTISSSAWTQPKPAYAPRTLTYLSPAHPSHPPDEGSTTCSLKIMTWNILAQCLVRRSLFPGSDCLKWKDRGPTITQEILDYAPDVFCLQEVDRVAEHSRVLSEAGYDMEYEIGGYETAGKQHGLMVGWKRTKLGRTGRRRVRLDEEEMGEGRRGLSRATRNVGLVVGLHFLGGPLPRAGLVVGTAHLFWHPRYPYERARQTGFLVRALRGFQQQFHAPNTPLFLAGDLNDQPAGPSYRLLCGAPMPQSQLDLLQASRLVHQSVDLLTHTTNHYSYTTHEGDEDHVFKDVRPATAADGLLTLPELRALVGPQKWRSLYGHWGHRMAGEDGNRFMDRRSPEEGGSERAEEDAEGAGLFEPMWTNFTPLWRATLDYIWVLTPGPAETRCHAEVLALLPSHRTAALLPGLPRLGIEPSDHVPLMALVQLLFPPPPPVTSS